MIAGGWPRGRATAALGAALAAVALSSAAAQAQTSFGIASFGVSASSQQAEAHTDFHTQFMLDTNARGGPRGQLRDVRVRLPAGITGGSSLVPRCSPTEFELLSCQPPAQVGVMTIFYKLSSEPSEQVEQVTVPLYNLAPVSGSSATFGTSLLATKILIEAELSKDGTYALEVVIQDLSNEIPVVGTSLTLWGVPASSTHDLERSRIESGGPQLIYGPPNESEEREVIGIEPTPAGVAPTPLLTSSSDCEGPPPTSTLLVESWEGQSDRATSPMPAPTGCELLRIAPSISIAPETTKRDTPSGYDIDIGYPIDEEPFELATPSLRSVALTLPVGTSLSLGVANGLVGCTETQFQAGECPGASKLGTATIDTPLLAKPLEGAIYLSAPTPEAMYRMLVTATGEGVTVRLIGVMHADPETGQLTVVFTENPQLPFSALDLHLFGGERAPLTNPATCGEASTTARFVSYGGQTASAASTFHIDANGFGGACPSPAQFTPSFIAGTLSPAAGSFSPFTLTVAREDGQQTLGGIAANLPPGLMGVLGTVPTCGEPAASLGGCPQSSLIGSAAIGVGAGASPLPLTGSVYLTGPYKGAPFGLAIVVPAIAGPFDLGTIVVRAQVKVTSGDLHLAIVTDPLPQILSGIPLRVRTISLDLSRPGFIVNPTSCSPMSVGAAIGSAQGASYSTSSPFQVSGCQALPFAPKLVAVTPARASSRGNGAGLNVQIAGATSGHANLESATINLPKPLKARLTTVQRSCLAATFAKNPAACPRESVVGNAAIHTPVLSTPLTGPVYLVFYRGIKYPKLVMVLQGSGVEIQLSASLVISKGISRTELTSLPDIPMSLFEMNLPEGGHSLLGSTTGLCSKPQTMSDAMIGQNGAQTKGAVQVTVAGCHARAARVGARRAKTSAQRSPARAKTRVGRSSR